MSMKKLASMLLAMVLVLAMAVPASAITISAPADGPEHTYVAYQIFVGDLIEENGSKTLAVTGWGDAMEAGSNTDLDDFLEAIGFDDQGIDNDFQAGEVAGFISDNFANRGGELAKILYNNMKHKENGKQFKTGEDVEFTEAGYYLIVDVTSGDIAEGDFVSANLLKMLGDLTIVPKNSNGPVIDKQVQEVNANKKMTSPDLYKGDWGEVADASIGDMVPFRVIVNTNDISNESYYALKITDTMSDSLKLIANDFKVYIGEGTTKSELEAKYYDITPAADELTNDFTLTIYVKNVIPDETREGGFINGDTYGAYSEDKMTFTVEYNAMLLANAEIGGLGNNNKAELDYKNDPKAEDWTKAGDDTVYVLTYEVPIYKFDGDDAKPLPGAVFELAKIDPNYDYAEGDPDIDYIHSIIARYCVDSQLAATANLKGSAWWSGDGPDYKTYTTNEKGEITIKGLDAGTYWLYEKTAPTGYNKPGALIKFTIGPSNEISDVVDENLDVLTFETITGGMEYEGFSRTHNSDGKLMVEIDNRKGGTLPETGGIGTTIFYAVGGLLVLAAVLLLVTKRRMGTNN